MLSTKDSVVQTWKMLPAEDSTVDTKLHNTILTQVFAGNGNVYA